MFPVRRLATDRNLFWAAFALCYCAALVPVWCARILPLCDLSTHLSAIAIWQRLPDPSWGYSKFYTLSRIPVPYWGFYYPTKLLAALVSVETATKLYLSAYAFALPASVAVLGARFGRSPALALLAFPLVYGHSFGWGFISYCAGVPMALLGLAYLDWFLRQERLGPLGFFGVFGASCGLYLMHLLPWLLFGVCAAGVMALRLRDRPSRAALAQVAAAAGALLASVALVALSARYVAAQNTGVSRNVLHLVGRWERPLLALRSLPGRLIIGWPDSATDRTTLVALLASWVALLVTARRRGAPRALGPWLLFALVVGLYLVTPIRLYQPVDWFNISPRFAVPIALFALLLVPESLQGWRRLLLLPALIASIYYPLALASRFRQYNERVRPFFEVIARVPRGSSTLPLLLGDWGDRAIDPQYVPFAGYHSYVQLFGGGYDPYAIKSGFPYREIAGRQLPAPPFGDPRRFSQNAQGRFYDFVITRNEGRDGELWGAAASKVPLVAKAGEWRLYATRGIVVP